MMTIAQRVSFELVPVDASASGFADAHATAHCWRTRSRASPAWIARACWFSADGNRPREAQARPCSWSASDWEFSISFKASISLAFRADGSFEVLERIEGGRHQVSVCAGAPALLGWATGNLPEPRNNPQVGMANMRTVMPALQKAKPIPLAAGGLHYLSATPPKQQRQTRVVKDMSAEQIAHEIAEWIGK